MFENEERKLVTVRTIDKIFEIPNADAIEGLVIGGWELVGKKGEFKEGDKCVFFEIDSFLPADDTRFAFLEKNFITWNKQLGARIKTAKFRKQISQGLALPLNQFPEIQAILNDPKQDINKVNLDELLHVLKYEKLDVNGNKLQSGDPEGDFPSFIPKTKQERIQNKTQFLQNNEELFTATQKIDGCSLTIFCKDGKVGVCSRNNLVRKYKERTWFDNLVNKLPNRLKIFIRKHNLIQFNNTRKSDYWDITEILNLEDALLKYNSVSFSNIAIQGEMFGPGLPGARNNPEKIATLSFRVYDIFDINKQQYLNNEEVETIIKKLNECGANNLEYVPVVWEGKLFDTFNGNIHKILEFADGKSLINPKEDREGLVFRNKDRTISFKVISNKYLLKHGE